MHALYLVCSALTRRVYICSRKPQKAELGNGSTGEGSCAESHSRSARKKERVSQELYGASLVDKLARSSKKKLSLVMQDGIEATPKNYVTRGSYSQKISSNLEQWLLLILTRFNLLSL